MASGEAMSSAIRTSPRRRQGRPRRAVPVGRARQAAPGAAHPTRDLIDPYWTDAGFLLALERFGYDVTATQKAVIAFQRRLRPDIIDGRLRRRMPGEIARLLLPRPQ